MFVSDGPSYWLSACLSLYIHRPDTWYVFKTVLHGSWAGCQMNRVALNLRKASNPSLHLPKLPESRHKSTGPEAPPFRNCRRSLNPTKMACLHPRQLTTQEHTPAARPWTGSRRKPSRRLLQLLWLNFPAWGVTDPRHKTSLQQALSCWQEPATEAPAEPPAEAPPAETLAESPVEAPAEAPTEVPTEAPGEAPAEAPAAAPSTEDLTGRGLGFGTMAATTKFRGFDVLFFRT